MKKAITLLSALVIIQTVYIMKSYNTPAVKYKKQIVAEERSLLEKLTKMGIQVEALSREEKLGRIFRVDIKNGRSFYTSSDGRYYFFGDVIDSVAKKPTSSNEKKNSMTQTLMINPQSLPDKQTALENVEKQLKTLLLYRDYLRREQ
nr:hypothetical protein BHI3_13790 [Bacteriovorax sp. HI3]